jgi:hypothetical protein
MGDQFKVLELVADRLQTVENSALRSSIAQELFGGRASELLLVLEEGAEGLAKIAQEAQDFGLVLSTATARNVEEANDAFTRLGSLFKGLRDTLVGALAPAFQEIADVIREKVLKAVADAGGIEKFGKKMALTLIDIFEIAARAVQQFVNNAGRALNRVLIFTKNLLDAVQSKLADQIDLQRDLFQQYNVVGTIFDDLRKKIEAASTSLDDFGKSGDKAEEKMKKGLFNVSQAYIPAVNNGINGLTDALTAVAMKTSSVSDAFKSMARSVIQDLIKIGIQQNITGPLAQTLFGTNPFALPEKAIGGPVQRNRAVVVGERGPEVFVPSRSGSIIANGDIAGGGVVVNQSINISTGVSATVRSEIASLLPQIAEASKAAVLDARRRGGSFSAAFS